jgi:hypothetical protein
MHTHNTILLSQLEGRLARSVNVADESSTSNNTNHGNFQANRGVAIGVAATAPSAPSAPTAPEAMHIHTDITHSNVNAPVQIANARVYDNTNNGASPNDLRLLAGNSGGNSQQQNGADLLADLDLWGNGGASNDGNQNNNNNNNNNNNMQRGVAVAGREGVPGAPDAPAALPHN